jgi:hypothetical protein
LSVQFGRSQGQDQSGSGLTVTAALRSQGSGDRNRWTLTTSWRDIDAGFSTIDSVSGAFLRAEKGLSANLSFAPTQHINFTTNFAQSRIAQQNYGFFGGVPGLGNSGDAPALVWADNTTWNSSLSLTLPNLPSLTLNHTQIAQNGFTRSTFTRDALRLAWQRGILSISGDLDRTTSRGRSVFGLYNGYGGYGSQNGTVIGGVNNGNGLFNDSSSTTSRSPCR